MSHWLYTRPQDRTLHSVMYRHVRRLGWLALDDEEGPDGEPAFEDAGNARAYEVAGHYFGMTISFIPPAAPVQNINTRNAA